MTKIIVTESQYQRLFEQKKPKIELFQELVNDGLEYIRGFCDETLSAEEYSGDVGFDSCDAIDVIESIEVNDIKNISSSQSDLTGRILYPGNSMIISITINFRYYKEYFNFDDFIYDMTQRLKKSTGGLPIILETKINNLNKNYNW